MVLINLFISDKTQHEHVELKNEENEESIIYYEVLEDEVLSDNQPQTDTDLIDNTNTYKTELNLLESAEDIDSITDTVHIVNELIVNKCTTEYHLDETENVEMIKKPRLNIEQDISNRNGNATTIVQVRPPATIITAASVADIIANETTQITLPDTNDSSNDDIYFVLSLIGTFKRLPPQKRAIAKCNILRYLTELEYGTTANL